LELDGLPVLGHTLCAFEQVEEVGRIVVVARTEDIPRIIQLSKQWGITKPLTAVEGGATRQQSVALGVYSLVDSNAELIAIHDGARPLVTPTLIRRVIEAAATHGAAAAAIPLKDTVKQVDEAGFVTNTPPRHMLRAVQTPQVFHFEKYRYALKQAAEKGIDCTDDCQLMEQSGFAVLLVDGEEENIKITTPFDTDLAVSILQSRHGEETL
jgi:2-C-methyl-D-erythritol 4-phosphate cytidylyltransferase